MSAINRVEQVLQSHQVESQIHHLDDSAHTAAQAAKALGCNVSQIVKSLIFKTSQSNQPILLLISGDKRADLEKLVAIIDQPIEKADAAFVKSTTGFSIGGVAPIGSLCDLPIHMDKTLLDHEIVWAAAGHPKSIFNIDPEKLAQITQAKIVDLTI